MEIQTLVLIVGFVAVLGVAAYLYVEHQARAMRTRLVDLPDGLRFEAHGFSVEVRRQSRQVLVHTRTGQWLRTPAGGGPLQTQNGPLEATFPAVGLRIEAAPMVAKAVGVSAKTASGAYTIVLRTAGIRSPDDKGTASEQQSVVRIENVSGLVAKPFIDFAARVRVWVEKMERRLELDRIAQARAAEEAIQRTETEKLVAEVRKDIAPDQPLTDADREAIAAAQIAKWRETAGFTGNASEVSIDAQGQVAWFVDLANDGHITVHSDQRTIHTTLLGASIHVQRGGELEIGLRDDYWTEDEPGLRFFRVFKGLSSDARRAWQEKLEMMRDNLQRSVANKS